MYSNHLCVFLGAEYRVFQKFYRDLISIIPITDLSPYLASENIITPTDDEEVTSPSTPTERARTLLLKISAHLKAGYSDSLRGLLDAMEKFGNQNCLELASKVKKDLELLVGEIQSMNVYIICSDHSCYIRLHNKMYMDMP